MSKQSQGDVGPTTTDGTKMYDKRRWVDSGRSQSPLHLLGVVLSHRWSQWEVTRNCWSVGNLGLRRGVVSPFTFPVYRRKVRGRYTPGRLGP